MKFTFAMVYKPAYQKRYGKCHHCEQGIVAGERIMMGSAFWQSHIFLRRLHFACYLETMQKAASDWFFENDFVAKRMLPEQKAALNRLRAKRYYLKKNGGDKNELDAKLAEVEKQIAFIKAEKVN